MHLCCNLISYFVWAVQLCILLGVSCPQLPAGNGGPACGADQVYLVQKSLHKRDISKRRSKSGPGHQMLLLAELEWSQRLVGEATHPSQKLIHLLIEDTWINWEENWMICGHYVIFLGWRSNPSFAKLYHIQITIFTFNFYISVAIANMSKVVSGFTFCKLRILGVNWTICGHFCQFSRHTNEPVQCNKSNVGKTRKLHWVLRVRFLCLNTQHIIFHSKNVTKPSTIFCRVWS